MRSEYGEAALIHRRGVTFDAKHDVCRAGSPVRVATDRAAWLALGLGAAMAATIAGTVLFGKAVGLGSIPLFLLAVMFLALRAPVIAIALYFGYAAMEGMYKYLSGFAQEVYIVAPLLLGVIVIGWGLSLRVAKVNPSKPPLMALIAMFAGLGLLQAFNPVSSGVLGSVAAFTLWYLGPIALYVVGYNTIKSSKQVMLFVYVLAAVCTVVSAFAVVQFSMGKEWTEAHLPGYAGITQTDWFVADDQGRITTASFRPASTTSMGGGGAGWSHLGVIVTTGLLFAPGVVFRRKVALAACLPVNVVGLLVTGVRLWLFVGVLEVLFLVMITARSPRDIVRSFGLLLAMAIAAGTAYAAAQSLSGGAIARRYADTAVNPLAKYKEDRGGNLTALSAFIVNYPLGIGFQQGLGREKIGARANDPDADTGLKMANGETQFGKTAAEMGVPGVILLLLLMAGCFVNGWRALRCLHNPHLRTIAAVLLASLGGYFVACFGGPALQGASYFWFAAATLTVLPMIEKRERKVTVAPAGGDP